MINKKFIAQLIGIIIGLLFIMLGFMTPLSTFIFCGIGAGLINFNIMVTNFTNISFTSFNFILPLALMIAGMSIIFWGLLSPLNTIIYGGTGMILTIVSVNLIIRINRVK